MTDLEFINLEITKDNFINALEFGLRKCTACVNDIYTYIPKSYGKIDNILAVVFINRKDHFFLKMLDINDKEELNRLITILTDFQEDIKI